MKKLQTKLSLSKQTISNLQLKGSAKQIKGGINTIVGPYCDTSDGPGCQPSWDGTCVNCGSADCTQTCYTWCPTILETCANCGTYDARCISQAPYYCD
jgi:hypothetical protein